MFESKIKSQYRKKNNERLYQGDILKDLKFVIGDSKKETEKDIISLPFAVILSQDCDMQSDFNYEKLGKNQDKRLLSLLICPAFLINEFVQGKHLENWQMEIFNKSCIKRIKKNDTYKRYHFLANGLDFSVPELVIDFKHFFTLPRDFLYKQRKNKYVASLNEIFREELSQRFSNYLSRIGIPELE